MNEAYQGESGNVGVIYKLLRMPHGFPILQIIHLVCLRRQKLKIKLENPCVGKDGVRL